MGQGVGQKGSDKHVLLQNLLSEKGRVVNPGESSIRRYAKRKLHKQRKELSSKEANCIEMLPVQGISSIAILGWVFRQQFCISI